MRAERSHRDNSPEQLEAMQHVAREGSEMESALGPIAPHRLHRYPAPVVPSTYDASAALLWLLVVAAVLVIAFAGLTLGWWAVA